MAQNPWNAIKRYQENGAGAISSLNIRYGNLRSGTGSDSILKVRKVVKGRVDEKSKRLKAGYVNSFPMCVRRTEEGELDLTRGVLGGTEMFDVFDGNHRYHAIKKLIEEGSTIFNDDTPIPCIIYKKSLSDTLAMTHAAIVNDMQMAANGGSVLDVLRFLSNMKARVLATNTNGPQSASGLSEKKVSEMVMANIVDFFNSQGTTTPSNWQGARFVPCALSFLKHLGAEGLAECERLLDRDPEGMYDLLTDIIEHVPGANLDALGKNRDFSAACFLPDCTYLYRISWRGISNRPGGAITLMQALYAKWFFGGGKVITEQELTAIIKDVRVDFNTPRPEPPYPEPPYLHPLETGVSEPVSTAEYEGQPVKARMQMVKNMTTEDLASEESFKDKLASLNLTLKEEVPEQLRKSFMAALSLCVPKEVGKDADSAEATAKGAEGVVWREHIGPPEQRPEPGHLAARHIVEDNLWILQHMAAGSTRRPGGAALETTTVAPEHIALFDSLLEALILVELVGTGPEANRASLVPTANTILDKCMRLWQDCELGQENPSPQFTAGRTFVNCEPTEQGVLIQEAERAKALKLHRDAAVVLGRQTRLDAASRKARLIQEFITRRNAERELAEAAVEEAVKSRYNDISGLLEEYSTRMTKELGETLHPLGLHPYGFGTIKTKSMPTLLPEHISVEQKAGIKKSTMFFIDSRDMHLAEDKAFSYIIDLYKQCGGTGVVSVLCEPDCVLYVYTLLQVAGYTHFDHPYLVEATQDASTLGNQQATDSWGVHPLLRKRYEENTPYGTPFAVIISATTKLGKKFAAWDMIKTDPKKFAQNLENTNPATSNAIRDKYRFALNISKYSQRDLAAPQCKEFPMVQAYANFLWWNLTNDEDFLVTCCGDASFPVCAVHAQSTYVLAFDFLPEGNLEEALHTAHLLSASDTPKDIHTLWNGYPLTVHLTICHDLAIAAMLQPNLDAISILFAQTKGEYRRVERSDDFWKTTFKPLRVMPCIVQMPGELKGTAMLGLEAEEDIDAGATLCQAQIFW